MHAALAADAGHPLGLALALPVVLLHAAAATAGAALLSAHWSAQLVPAAAAAAATDAAVGRAKASVGEGTCSGCHGPGPVWGTPRGVMHGRARGHAHSLPRTHHQRPSSRPGVWAAWNRNS